MDTEGDGFDEIARAPAAADQIVLDMEPVGAFAVDGIAVHDAELLHLVPARGAGLGRDVGRVKAALHIPENIVVDQIDAVTRAFNENSLTLFTSVEEKIARDTVVLVSDVHP